MDPYEGASDAQEFKKAYSPTLQTDFGFPRCDQDAVNKYIQEQYEQEMFKNDTRERLLRLERELAEVKKFSPLSVEDASEQRKNINRLEVEIQDREKEIKRLAAGVERSDSLLEACWAHMATTNQKLALSADKLSTVKAEYDNLEYKFNLTEVQLNALKAEHDDLESKVELDDDLVELIPDLIKYALEKKSKKKGAMKLSAVKIDAINSLMKKRAEEYINLNRFSEETKKSNEEERLMESEEGEKVDDHHKTSDGATPTHIGEYVVEPGPAEDTFFRISFYTFGSNTAEIFDISKFKPTHCFDITTTTQATPSLAAVHMQVKNVATTPVTLDQTGNQGMAAVYLDSLVLSHRYEMLDLQKKACYHRVRASEARELIGEWIQALSEDDQKGQVEDPRVLQVFGYPKEMEREVTTAFALQDFV